MDARKSFEEFILALAGQIRGLRKEPADGSFPLLLINQTAEEAARLVESWVPPEDPRLGQMREALVVAFGRLKIGAVVVDCDYDPAGSSYSFEPDKRDLELLEKAFGRPFTEDDLFFVVGSGTTGTHYVVREAALEAAKGAPRQPSQEPSCECRHPLSWHAEGWCDDWVKCGCERYRAAAAPQPKEGE